MYSRIRTLAIVLSAAIVLAACSAPAAIPTSIPTASAKLAQAESPTATSLPAVEPTATTVTEQPASAETSSGTKFELVSGQTTASYKLREQLANVSLPNDVIGKTQAVTGSIVFLGDGTIDAANSKITVDVTGLQTDQAMRDNYVRRNVLETSKYPNVTFAPKTLQGLPTPLPASGQVSFQMSGDLTIKDVTKPVTWDVSGTINGDQATGTATVTFKFADFNLTQPRVPVVLSIEDHITLQLDLVLQKTSK